MNFYLTQNGQKLGPYTVEQIQQFVRQGLATPHDQVWSDGWPAWMPISNVPGLASPQSTVPPSYAPPLLHQVPVLSTNQQQKTEAGYAKGKNPILACVLSLAIVGVGQFYNGDWNKGWILLITCVIAAFFSFGLLWFFWAAFSAVDAYRVASQAKPLEQYFPI